MKLYEFGPTRSIRARWILQELGVDFDAVSVDLKGREHCSPDFLELNPAGKVPVLIDGDLVLSESVAIVLYLAHFSSVVAASACVAIAYDGRRMVNTPCEPKEMHSSIRMSS